MHRRWLLLTFLAGVSISCTHAQKADRSEADSTVVVTAASAEPEVIREGPGTQNDLNDQGTDLNSIPTEVNRLVLSWIDYFQGRGRPHMERYLARSTRYTPMMKEILKKHGLPEDLVYIALIESGFSSSAHSSANAVGYWQFIRGTGKRYGMQIDSYVDERRDFVRSTHAAAEYYKGLYNLFGSWYLAIASYNVGENRVKNVVMKYHTRDFWQLARDNKLPRETIDYIPKFLAARMIAKEPEKYGFAEIEYMEPLTWAEITTDKNVDLHKMAESMGVPYEDLKDLNPMYRRGVAIAKDGKLTLRVPVGSEQTAVAALDASAVSSPRGYVAAVADADIEYVYHRVRRGENLASIARKYHTNIRKIRNLNRLSSKTRLAIGRRLKVPAVELPVVSRDEIRKSMRTAKNSRRPSNGDNDNQRVHIVRRGDTLFDIARQYRVSIRSLTETNQIGRASKINVGHKLVIPD